METPGSRPGRHGARRHRHRHRHHRQLPSRWQRQQQPVRTACAFAQAACCSCCSATQSIPRADTCSHTQLRSPCFRRQGVGTHIMYARTAAAAPLRAAPTAPGSRGSAAASPACARTCPGASRAADWARTFGTNIRLATPAATCGTERGQGQPVWIISRIVSRASAAAGSQPPGSG
eukprot:COSAG01_NODE_744_length_13876_cov_4.660449_2_plen_176_part_00